MTLAILTSLICLAHLLAATCPPYRPLTARQGCQTNSDCQSGKSCCGYRGSYVCVSTDPNTCIHKGKIVEKGKSVLLEDNCSTCECRGYDDFLCLNDGCYWPKLPANDTARCPQYRPFTAKQWCRTNSDCPSGKSCCGYSGSNVCVSTDPNTCIHKGKIVEKGKSVLLEDNCSTCECRGYDDFLCLNDGCYWPKVPANDTAKCPQYRPLTARQRCLTKSDCPSGKSCCTYLGASYCVSTDPNTCNHDGAIVKKGQSIVLKDNCSTCNCRGYDDFLCTNDGCIWPKPLPRSCVYKGTARTHGSSFRSADGCNTCFCNDGNVGCTLMICLHRRFPFRRTIG